MLLQGEGLGAENGSQSLEDVSSNNELALETER
jgi:hypothetical protein